MGTPKATFTFEDLRAGMCARVVACTACTEEHLRLQELGLTEGATFKVMKVAPFGDPIEIDLRGYRLCLRKSENCAFQIETTNVNEAVEAQTNS